MSPAARVPPRAKSGPLLPVIIGGALFMQTLDSFILTNALPTMARSLHTDVLRLNLAITAYLLASAVSLPLSAWVADRYGARQVFRGAIVAFALSSALCGLSTTLAGLVLARALQGLAGALMVPVGRLVLLRNVPKSELVQALSWLTMPAVFGPILGPPFSGLIVTYASWRWIFFINLPIGAVGLVLASLYIPNVREDIRRRLDRCGFFLVALGLAGINFGFDNLGHGTLSTLQVCLLLGGGGFFLAAYAIHARYALEPILDLSVLRLRTFRGAVLGGLFSRLIIGATPFLLALLLQIGFGLSALTAGLLSFAGAIGSLVMKTLAPPIIRRLGFRNLLIGNALTSAASAAVCAAFRVETPHALIFTALFIGGFFRSLQFTALNALTFAEIDDRRMSRASSLATVVQQMSQSLGVGLAASVVQWSRIGRHASMIGVPDIAPGFLAISVLSLVGVCFFVPLPTDAGAELSGRQATGGRAGNVLPPYED